MSKIAIIGGGAAGMIAAISAAECGNEVSLFEQNEKLGKKIYITGKGRCNLCNACTPEEFFGHVEKNEKFMYGPYYGFDSDMTMSFFEENGLSIKVERGNRVFPVSDHASDVTKTLEHKMRELGVKIYLNTKVKNIETKDGRVSGIILDDENEFFAADSVIVATGGKSYETTGSRGDGYTFAKKLGHKVNSPLPSLVPFETKEEFVKDLQGLSLRNVALTVGDGKKPLYKEQGEMLFTHFGISGPLVLTASCAVTEKLAAGEKIPAYIDLKPALSEDTLKERIIRDVSENPRKKIETLLGAYLPGKMVSVFAELLPFDTSKVASELTKDERSAWINLLKALPLTIIGTRGLKEAIITRGGIDVKEIDPGTMQSKIVPGLFFAGEVIDVDAQTGGFNLQIAWSTGHLAGLCAGI